LDNQTELVKQHCVLHASGLTLNKKNGKNTVYTIGIGVVHVPGLVVGIKVRSLLYVMHHCSITTDQTSTLHINIWTQIPNAKLCFTRNKVKQLQS